MIRASLICDTNKKSFRTKLFLQKKIKLFPITKSNLILVVGGDGFMLQTLKKYYKFKKLFYGINSGSYGFLMNKFSKKNTIKNLSKAKIISPNSPKILFKDVDLKFGYNGTDI